MIHINLVNGLKYFTLEPVLDKTYHYRFETIVEDFSNSKRVKKISYIRNVEVTLYERTEIIANFQLFLSKMYIESKTTEPNEFLTKQMSYAFDEIEVGVNYKGQILYVYNMKEMSDRWEKTKNELLIHNKGYAVADAFETISDLLRNEEELILYLSDYKMYGLYFTGFFGKYNLWEMPVIRTQSIVDFKNSKIEESIYPEQKDKIYYTIFGKTNTERKPIENGFDVYKGELSYVDFQLEEAYLEVQNEEKRIQYNVLLRG
ncbi:hypothetical protein ACFSX9_14040 [Flavobacterium ardleyense]|uniref:Lipoprotein n=1 Tax=Flavobacterium ardleyense TaxID=2038737 RepID=A0ABW5ZAD5_9FLAO